VTRASRQPGTAAGSTTRRCHPALRAAPRPAVTVHAAAAQQSCPRRAAVRTTQAQTGAAQGEPRATGRALHGPSTGTRTHALATQTCLLRAGPPRRVRRLWKRRGGSCRPAWRQAGAPGQACRSPRPNADLGDMRTDTGPAGPMDSHAEPAMRRPDADRLGWHGLAEAGPGRSALMIPRTAWARLRLEGQPGAVAISRRVVTSAPPVASTAA
jgi:hypothetical protein